ncbi:uncharacterized protein N7459_008273 [Penicillium hispanicum]|uniref:uncharacterized protein n=1 Tax=Penicillium hispanicum TaxID=1080232 RepID=UPI00253F8CA5|nr:uncharacterized protein N7459_008273 [Penicillium hispanicum]KAJ5573846.1 hypothetical protein N7459_008273 [Penicillium hispanicum]
MPLVGRSLAIFTESIIMMSLSIVAVSLRTFVRVSIVRAFGWDDALMVAALLLFVALSIICIVGSMNGVGHKLADFKDMAVYRRALLWWWLGQIIYIWSSSLAKVSIAVALLRLTVRPVHVVILWVVIGTVIAIGTMFWLVLLLDCRPISYFWNRIDPSATGTCTSVDTLVDITYLYSVITIFCDFALGILPVFLVRGLQMNQRTKIAVVGILSLGAIASVAVVIRLPFLDSTYQIALWSDVETGLGIIAGSLITLRPLFRWFLDEKIYGRNRRYRASSSQQWPLSSLESLQSDRVQALPAPRDPAYWRPDLNGAGKAVVTTVSAPRGRHLGADSSEECLNPSLGLSPDHVNIHETITVTERLKPET